MKQQFIGKHLTNQLLLFFCGWGMDPHPFVMLRHENRDIMCCYDYRDLSFNTKLVEGYKDIQVVAWSLGVWVASKILPTLHLPISFSSAVNGTLTPIDDLKGIPPSIFQGTIDHLDERNLKKFQRRMCQSAEEFQTLMEVAPTRTILELKQELIALKEEITHSDSPEDWKWDQVFIGLDDHIFPSNNQQKAWKGLAPLQLIQAGHYCPKLFKQLINHDQ